MHPTEPPPKTTTWLTVDQAAEIVNVHPNSIYAWLKTGLPHRKAGRLVRIVESELDAFLDPHRNLNSLIDLQTLFPQTTKTVAEANHRATAVVDTEVSPMAAINVYPNSGTDAFFGKFKDGGKWKSKTIPVIIDGAPCRPTLNTEAQAKAWFADWYSKHGPKPSPEETEGTDRKTVPPSAVLVPTFENLFEQWEKYLRTKTVRGSKKVLDTRTTGKMLGCAKHHILTHPIAKVPLNEKRFTLRIVRSFVQDTLTKDLSNVYIRDIVGALRTFIHDARFNWIELPSNPVDDPAVKELVPSPEERQQPLSLEQVIQLISCDDPRIADQHKVLNLVAITTGLRKSELRGLDWSRVDLEKAFISVDRQLGDRGSKVFFRPAVKKGKKAKSEASTKRKVPLHPLTLQALTWWKDQLCNSDPSLPVFPRLNTKDQFDVHSNAAETFRANLQVAKVDIHYTNRDTPELFKFHATRSTFLNLAAHCGIPKDVRDAFAGQDQEGSSGAYMEMRGEVFQTEIAKLPLPKTLPWLK